MVSDKTIRYMATVAYDGTNFAGFQIQPKERTVQGELEKVLSTITKGEFIRIQPSGRTDAGAHAKGLVLHFDFLSCIPEAGLYRAMNTLLPEDIVISELVEVSEEFHARYSPSRKLYTYRVDNNKMRNPFTRQYVYHHPYEMNLKRAQEALDILIGTHDFTSFCSTKTDKEDKTRTLYRADIDWDKELNEWIFTFEGDGFLYNMIRIIMGTVLPIADGRQPVHSMAEILEKRDRTAAGPTLSAKGLCLEKVIYLKEK